MDINASVKEMLKYDTFYTFLVIFGLFLLIGGNVLVGLFLSVIFAGMITAGEIFWVSKKTINKMLGVLIAGVAPLLVHYYLIRPFWEMVTPAEPNMIKKRFSEE